MFTIFLLVPSLTSPTYTQTSTLTPEHGNGLSDKNHLPEGMSDIQPAISESTYKDQIMPLFVCDKNYISNIEHNRYLESY